MLHHWQMTIKSLQFCWMDQSIGDNVVKGPGDWWTVKGSDYSGPLDKDETEKQETTMGKVGWRPRERGLKWRPQMLSLLSARWQHEIGTILKMLGQDSNLHPQQSKMGCGGKNNSPMLKYRQWKEPLQHWDSKTDTHGLNVDAQCTNVCVCVYRAKHHWTYYCNHVGAHLHSTPICS